MLDVQLREGFHVFEHNGAFSQSASANNGVLLSIVE